MKNIFKAFAMLAFVATMGMMTSCSKDDTTNTNSNNGGNGGNNSANYAELIIGTWHLTALSDGTQNYPTPSDVTWEFTTEGELIAYLYESGGLEETHNTYVLSGNNLTIVPEDVPGDAHTYQIIELNNTKLAIEIHDGSNTYQFIFTRV